MANEIKQNSLPELHQNNCAKGNTYTKQNTTHIINLLGGINNVLTNYLNEANEIEISKYELNELYKILTIPKKRTPNEVYKDLQSHYQLNLNEEDSYLRSIFGDYISTKILMYIVHSKCIQIVATLSVIIWFIFGVWDSNSFGYLTYSISVCGCIWIPYNVFWILSANKTAFKLIVTSFEYWFKLTYAFIYCILNCVYKYHHYTSDTYTDDGHHSLQLLRWYTVIILMIHIPFFITSVSSFDAFHMDKRWKILISGTLATIFSIWSLKYTLLINHKHDYFYHSVTTGIAFSFCGLMASTMRVLALFLWKQSLKTLYVYGMNTSRCVLICYFPYIRWNPLKIASSSRNSAMIYTDDMDRALLHQLHEEQLLNGISNDHNTLEIINILGGIDKVLSNYLNAANQIDIEKDSIQLLYQVLSTPDEYESDEMDDIQTNRCVNTPFEMNLYSNDSYLRSIFGSYVADKILRNIVHSTFIQIICTLSILIWFIFVSMDGESYTYLMYTIIVCCGIWIPYNAFWILSANKTAFKLILQSFEFYLKFLCAVIYGILNSLYRYNLYSRDGPYQHSHPRLRWYTVIILMVHIPIFITSIASFDAYHINKVWKILISATLANVFAFWSIKYLFSVNAESDYFYQSKTTGVALSICSFMASAMRILSIFLWRQSLKTLWDYIRKREKCVLFSYYPYIQWNKHINDDQYKSVSVNVNDDKPSWIDDV